MDEFERYQTLIDKYEAQIQREPRSKVFAPLAEIYRKLGSLDKSLEILKQGIRYNPEYVLGYLGLAACYKDLGQHQLNYVMLKPLTSSNKDNIKLLKYFAESAELTNNFQEALETFKFILFLNPKDQEAIVKVKYLESKNDPSQTILNYSETFDEAAIDKNQDKLSIDDWILFDIAKDSSSIANKKNTEIKKQAVLVEEKAKVATKEKVDATPVITHTLVDLYIKQGHLEKANEILEKILLLNPSDHKTLEKKNEVQELMKESFEIKPIEQPRKSITQLESEDEARRKLLELIDEKVTSRERPDIETKLWEFHQKLVKRARNDHASDQNN